MFVFYCVCILLCLYFIMFVFYYVCILLCLYFIMFVFYCVCILLCLHFIMFVFYYVCILLCLYFIMFVFYYVCILLCLHFIMFVFYYVCILLRLYFIMFIVSVLVFINSASCSPSKNWRLGLVDPATGLEPVTPSRGAKSKTSDQAGSQYSLFSVALDFKDGFQRFRKR